MLFGSSFSRYVGHYIDQSTAISLSFDISVRVPIGADSLTRTCGEGDPYTLQSPDTTTEAIPPLSVVAAVVAISQDSQAVLHVL
jgi:hypothetical protein